jgi:hypothetical protein
MKGNQMKLILLAIFSISFTFSGLASADSAKGKKYPTVLVPAPVKPEPKVELVKKSEPNCIWKETKSSSFTSGRTFVNQGLFVPGCSSCCGGVMNSFLPGTFYQEPDQTGTVVKLELDCI